MMKEGINNITNINFTAQKVACAKNTYKGITTHLNIFKLGASDNKFLKTLLEKDFFIKDSATNLSEEKMKIWKDVLKLSIFNSMEKDNISYLATFNNKPCGLISMQGKNPLNLLNLVAIPIDGDKKANLVGKTLLYKSFADACKNKVKKISLEAVKNSPGDPLKKYLDIGFEKIEEGSRYVQMECSRENIKKQLHSLKKEVNLKECNPKNFDLNRYLD